MTDTNTKQLRRGDTAGPFRSDYGVPFFVRLSRRGVWRVGFDVDENGGRPWDWLVVDEVLNDQSIEIDYRMDIRARAKEVGCI